MASATLVVGMKRQRTVQQKKLALITNYLAGINSTNFEQVVPEEIDSRLTILESIKKKFDEIQEKILDNLDVGEDESEDMQAVMDFEEAYIEAHSKIMFLKNTKRRSSHLAIKDDPTEKSSELVNLLNALVKHDLDADARNAGLIEKMSSMRGASAGKLPILELPKFDGDYREFVRFRDNFKSIIDSHRLEDATKLQYLVRALTKEPFDLIVNLDKDANGYRIAWELLEKRYNKRRVIIDAHLQLLFDHAIVPENSPEKLRQLVAEFSKQISVLEKHEIPVAQWDVMLVYLLKSKLGERTVEKWNEELDPDEMPTAKKMLEFLEKRCRVWEERTSSPQASAGKEFRKKSVVAHATEEVKNPAPKQTKTISSQKVVLKCSFCGFEHMPFKCRKFLALAIDSRRSLVRAKNLCFVCLKDGHMAKSCSSGSCTICGESHNTLLHVTKPAASGQAATSLSAILGSTDTDADAESNNCAISMSVQSEFANYSVLLATALVNVYDKQRNIVKCRVLLDCGSQSNFVTEECCDALSLQEKQINLSINGINQKRSTCTRAVDATIKSRCNKFATTLRFHVLPQITGMVPRNNIDVEALQIPKAIKLADPTFHLPGKVDMLLGAEMFFDLLSDGRIKSCDDGTILQNTQLGWIVAGKYVHENLVHVSQDVLQIGANEDLHDLIRNFWELEAYQEIETLEYTIEEQACENNFVNHVRRMDDGRFCVKLPRGQPKSLLGDSFRGALACFLRMEKSVAANPALKDGFGEFMEEYIRLGHMSPVDVNKPVKNAYYMPHHAILRPDSATTKLRVVFNASFKTSTGVSLNDILMTGPSIQKDLVSVILRFRLHQFVFTADISKMYRQVMIDEADRDMQRIIWRSEPDKPLQVFQLNTVTYGTAPASFLATRCLKQLQMEGATKFPLGAAAIGEFYMDDVMTGANTLEAAMTIQKQLVDLLQSGGFDLHKWSSNHPAMLMGISNNNISQVEEMKIDVDETVKTLGLFWNPNADFFFYKVKMTDSNQINKRSILSDIAKLFDPLGFLGPIVVEAKIIMRELWKSKVDWDDPLPTEMQERWTQYRQQLSELKDLKIFRWLDFQPNQFFELHGFCDASESSYGAVIYMRCIDDEGNVSCNFVCAKSKIAPIKSHTIPRLELCGALLLAQLMEKTVTALGLKSIACHCWTDSTTVLTWLPVDPARLVQFVRNRVKEITKRVKADAWFYVKGAENPADILSRGAKPAHLIGCNSWWSGPQWLPHFSSEKLEPIEDDKSPDCLEGFLPEQQTTLLSVDTGFELIEHFESASKTIRIVAYLRRFIHWLRTHEVRKGPLTAEEREQALIVCIKGVQRSSFKEELRDLSAGRQVSKSSKLRSLSPILLDGIVRAAGRLNQASIPTDAKQPIIMPSNHKFMMALARMYHATHLHAGPQLLLSVIRRKYWPLRGRALTTAVVRRCVTCFRAKPRMYEQLMGELPIHRVTQPFRPFLNCAVDFAGPVYLKASELKKAPKLKAYIGVFLCMATKAMHLELVGALTSEAFVAAVKRMVGRRGICQNIHSDNGTNFVGASNEMTEFNDWLSKPANQNAINQGLSKIEIKWHFSPAYSPHRGGIWEAAVKSVKHHLKRILGNSLLTYEHHSSILVDIEAVLNSRPLTPMSSDPTDLRALTPGHFLIGDELTSIPERILTEVPNNRLSKWEFVQKLKQHFWQRWSREYLPYLQQRTKWRERHHPIAVGEMVLVQDDQVVPMKWPLGRVVKLRPGPDKRTRTVDVQTSRGIITRAIQYLCPIPVEANLASLHAGECANSLATMSSGTI